MTAENLHFRLNFKGLFFIIFACEFLFFVSFNQALAVAKSKTEPPTRIRSDIIDIKRKSQTINFLNNVVVEREDSSLLAQKMTVIYSEKTQNSDPQIKRIDATKNVKIFSEEFVGSGDKGHYNPNKDIFVLEKNVIVNNGTSIASGDKFIYSLKTKKGHFVGPKNETSITGNGGDRRVVIVIGNDMKDKMDKKNKK